MDAEDQFLSGHNAHKEGEFETAIRRFQQLVEKYPDSYLAHFWAAETYLKRGEAKFAHYHYSRALEIEPDKAYAWKGKGIASLQLGDDQGAYESFLEVIDIDPKDAIAPLNLGKICYSWNDYEGSEYGATLAIGNDPRCGLAYALRANARTHLGKREKAKTDLEVARDLGVQDDILIEIEHALANWDAA
jgi:tetratricopeptide (TPR) repeat protein